MLNYQRVPFSSKPTRLDILSDNYGLLSSEEAGCKSQLPSTIHLLYPLGIYHQYIQVHNIYIPEKERPAHFNPKVQGKSATPRTKTMRGCHPGPAPTSKSRCKRSSKTTKFATADGRGRFSEIMPLLKHHLHQNCACSTCQSIKLVEVLIFLCSRLVFLDLGLNLRINVFSHIRVRPTFSFKVRSVIKLYLLVEAPASEVAACCNITVSPLTT